MESRHVSSMISDLVLALTSFGCAAKLSLWNTNPHTSVGLALVGLAAFIGVLKFGLFLPSHHEIVKKVHGWMAWFASIVGLPLMAAGFCFHHQKQGIGNLHLASAGAGLMLSFVPTSFNNNLSKLVSTLAVLGILATSVLDKNFYGVCGVIAYISAGGLQPIDELLGLRGVDWFHYALAVGNMFFMYGIILTKVK